MSPAVDAGALLHELMTDARLDAAAFARDARAAPPWLRLAQGRRATSRLPAPPGPQMGLPEVLQERRSVRSYTRTEVSLPELAAILHAADAGDRRDWDEERDGGVDLTLAVLAWRVAGLPAAAYRYAPPDHALVRIGPLPGAPAGELVGQPELTLASAAVVAGGNLAAAVARHGSHGYRQLLLRAGAAAHLGALAAGGLGLGSCLFTGLLPALRRVVRADGYRDVPLLGLAVGRAAGGVRAVPD